MHRPPDQLNSGMLPETPARFVRVIIDRAIHRELDYSVPEGLADRVAVGSRLRVPFREKSSLATVVRILEETDVKGLREIEAVVGDAPALSPPLLELAKWMGDYYCCPIEPVIRSLPRRSSAKGRWVGKNSSLSILMRRSPQISCRNYGSVRRGRRNSLRPSRSCQGPLQQPISCARPRSTIKHCAGWPNAG